MTVKIAPSILSADFANLGKEISAAEQAGADIIHIDVMDGHFVNNITIGPPVVKGIRKTTKLPLDCHLMIEHPEKYVGAFAEAGADWISVHIETCNPDELIPLIKEMECMAGVVINPPTDVNDIIPFLKIANYVLIMTVNPGFGGQKMIPECIEKIRVINDYSKENGLNLDIEVDGGVNPNTVSEIISAGADIIVAGSAVFRERNYRSAIDSLKNP